ncbi:hypothetical protein FKM82_022676 [Ascaphus truei]
MSQYSHNYLLVPIPEYPLLDCVPNRNIKIVVLGGSGVGKTGALYSRKVAIDGEQISLQVQDTPFVSMEVRSIFVIYIICGIGHESAARYDQSASVITL